MCYYPQQMSLSLRRAGSQYAESLTMNSKIESFFDRVKNKNILIQGLGLNGGGIATARFFLEKGIPVTITDLKDAEILKPAVKELNEYSSLITYRLGSHVESDFARADIVVKGPGVPPNNRFLKAARENGAEITSDISIFLELTPCPVYAVTGSKGKSTTVTAIYNIFRTKSENAYLGGNITISPLTFYDKLNSESLLILELSSWQLRDIGVKGYPFKGAAITNLMNDHQNYYNSMDDYLDDKKIITTGQAEEGFLIIPAGDHYLNEKRLPTKAGLIHYGVKGSSPLFYRDDIACIEEKGKTVELFDYKSVKAPGIHNRNNLLVAAGFCYLAGVELKDIKEGVATFKNPPYRLELVREWQGLKFINDTTATIPEAAANAIRSFTPPIIWIGGGTDKNLDFSIMQEVSAIPEQILLLEGSGTELMKKKLNRSDIIESASLDELVEKAVAMSSPGTTILFSPGCTSFGLFLNEFHRGQCFNKIVKGL